MINDINKIDWTDFRNVNKMAEDYADYAYAKRFGLTPVRLDGIYNFYYGMTFEEFLNNSGSHVPFWERVNEALDAFSKICNGEVELSKKTDEQIKQDITDPFKFRYYYRVLWSTQQPVEDWGVSFTKYHWPKEYFNYV